MVATDHRIVIATETVSLLAQRCREERPYGTGLDVQRSFRNERRRVHPSAERLEADHFGAPHVDALAGSNECVDVADDVPEDVHGLLHVDGQAA